MITHSIKAPSLVQRLVDRWKSPHSPLTTPRVIVPEPYKPAAVKTTPNGGYDKRRFAVYIENVRNRFKVGDLVTWGSYPAKNDVPVALHKIVYIQELWYDCEFDSAIGEPRCLILQNLTFPDLKMVPATASRMRHLTQQELSHVDVQHLPA